jgi:hypothetical protein
MTYHYSHGKANKDEYPEHLMFGTLQALIPTLKQMMKTPTSVLMVVSLCASIVINIVGLAKTEQWSQNPWLLTVLIALLWGVLQESSYPNLSTS